MTALYFGFAPLLDKFRLCHRLHHECNDVTVLPSGRTKDFHRSIAPFLVTLRYAAERVPLRAQDQDRKLNYINTYFEVQHRQTNLNFPQTFLLYI